MFSTDQRQSRTLPLHSLQPAMVYDLSPSPTPQGTETQNNPVAMAKKRV